MSQGPIKLKLEPPDETVRALHHHWGEVLSKLGLDEAPKKWLSNLELCVTEALANALKHGQPPSGPQPVWVTFTRIDGGVEVEIRDHGLEIQGFEERLRTLPDPLAESGRGLPLMGALMDRVTYKRTENENRLTLFSLLSTDTE